jgi:hypothetical protein
MSLAILDGPTIQRGQSLSDGLDCSAGNIVRITVPQEYTPANLTFQVSSDGAMYNDLFDEKGKEITVVAHPNTGIVIFEVWARTINFIKFRSGTRSHPVEQTKDDCKFAVAIETSAPAAR